MISYCELCGCRTEEGPMRHHQACIAADIERLRAQEESLSKVVEAAREYRDASEANRRAALQFWTDENRVIIAGRVSAARDALFTTLDQAPPKGGQ